MDAAAIIFSYCQLMMKAINELPVLCKSRNTTQQHKNACNKSFNHYFVYRADQYLAFFGKAGVGTCFGGLVFSCCITISIAFSNCGSCPPITSEGHCSTSTSGGVPTFSIPKP